MSAVNGPLPCTCIIPCTIHLGKLGPHSGKLRLISISAKKWPVLKRWVELEARCTSLNKEQRRSRRGAIPTRFILRKEVQCNHPFDLPHQMCLMRWPGRGRFPRKFKWNNAKEGVSRFQLARDGLGWVISQPALFYFNGGGKQTAQSIT